MTRDQHQSDLDPLMAFRLLVYMVRIWERYLADHPKARRLPAILPLVVHHSDKGWRLDTTFEALLDLDPPTLAALGEHMPRFRFVLDDIADQLREEGRRKGLVEGERKGLIEGERKGLVKGRREGLVEGKREGLVEGLVKGKRDTLLKLLALRFGALPEAVTARVRVADGAQLDQWTEGVLTAPALDALFRDA